MAASPPPRLPALSSAVAPGAAQLASPASRLDLEAALALVLQPRVDLRALGGVIHTCALYGGAATAEDGEGEDVLRNIVMGADAPRSLFDWLVVCAMRARASATLASGASLRAEGGGATPLFGEPFADGARALRARAGLEAAGAVCLMTRGELPLEPAWPIFIAGNAAAASGAGAAPATAPTFSPVIFLPDAAARERVVARFDAAAAPRPPPPAHVVEGLSAQLLLADIRAALVARGEGGDAGDASPLLPLPLPRRSAGAGPDLVFVECGPSVTRSFYSVGGDAADPGAPLAKPRDVPVDWLLLSTYRGPLKPAALGAPLVRRSTVCALFERVASGAARGDDEAAGLWAFELWRRRA
jgi:hypothetical protein